MPETPDQLHRTAAILSIGDELALGQSLDTNSQRLAVWLTDRGVRVVEHATVADDLPRHTATIRRLSADADLLLMTGGLGPTADDLTRQAVADALGERLVEDAEALAQVRAYFAARGRPMPERNTCQALRPASGVCLRNDHGTAPGLWATARTGTHECDLLCLPGPPREMLPMLERELGARLRPDPARVIVTRVLPTFGLGESAVAERLGDLMARDRSPLVGTTASAGIVSVRIRDESSPTRASAEAAVAADEAQVRDLLGAVVLETAGEPGADPLVASVGSLLRERRHTVGSVESCTGGLLGQMLTALPGSSAFFAGGLLTYSNALKAALAGVPDSLLAEHGAVSRPVALAMAAGGRERLGTHHCLAITGVAGPAGGTEAKPVGTVWIALDSAGAAPDVRRFRFAGGRDAVREWAARAALGMLRLRLLAPERPVDPQPLLGQVE